MHEERSWRRRFLIPCCPATRCGLRNWCSKQTPAAACSPRSGREPVNTATNLRPRNPQPFSRNGARASPARPQAEATNNPKGDIGMNQTIEHDEAKAAALPHVQEVL